MISSHALNRIEISHLSCFLNTRFRNVQNQQASKLPLISKFGNPNPKSKQWQRFGPSRKYVLMHEEKSNK
ncbi:hypothetical protein I3760_10G140200 [Carya illinoinensis]|nr:hypothetical protein I3760_10G140200 [Carya illinoinensis]